MLGSVARTSTTRRAETAARGAMTKIIEINRKAKMACIAYCRKASMSPICNVPSAIRCAPTQTTATEVRLKISSNTGCMTASKRLTTMLTWVSSRFVSSNRVSSEVSRLKARITRKPVSRSRVTRLSWSIRSCSRLNLGSAAAKSIATTTMRMPTATAMIHVMDGARW